MYVYVLCHALCHYYKKLCHLNSQFAGVSYLGLVTKINVHCVFHIKRGILVLLLITKLHVYLHTSLLVVIILEKTPTNV